MKIRFYFDPSCPFCWITSRWLLMVSAHRDLTVEWKPFSLAMKNNELGGDESATTKHGETHRGAHRVLRVMMAAERQGVPLIDMYTAFGIKFHVAGFAYDDEMIADILSENNLPTELIKAADDTSYDAELRDAMQSAIDVAGEDIGVPTILFETADGDWNGFFGPVLQTLPDLDDALKLWDGLAVLAADKNFYELKRSRPSGGPDVASTAKC